MRTAIPVLLVKVFQECPSESKSPGPFFVSDPALHGFPHDAVVPSHTQETSLGKNLTVRERLSICDGPVTD